jgi:transcriptional regulator with GAF, ATPase, and Fis domain
MERFRALLLDVWREACRHLEAGVSAVRIARILARRMPIDRLLLLAFEPGPGLLTPRAAWAPDRTERDAGAPRDLAPADRLAFLDWARSGRIDRLEAGGIHADLYRIFLGNDRQDGAWLAVPLGDKSGVCGGLLLRARPDSFFEPIHILMAGSLVEPFTVLLENDRRLLEMKALRDAAEADKRSALSRLGREKLVTPVVGADGGLRSVMQRVGLVAKSDLPVLILGETGTGKEVIARNIHEQSPRRSGPFIRVNCGAIPPELIDSELFGHERGAFTGAASTRRGWFERADQGTLLLDEIGDLPTAAQVRLLRVLQEGTFERVGAERPIHVSVRMIAATHRDLPGMIQAGSFREDLWYRITSFPIVLPPLRERKQDIPALANHFAARAALRFGLRAQMPSERDLQLLLAYDWPGNIRELASVIDRAAILGDGEGLEIGKALGLAGRNEFAVYDREPEDPFEPDQPFASLDHAMRRHIEAALVRTRGRIEGENGAARMLDINPHTLRARMRKLGIDWRRFRKVEG